LTFHRKPGQPLRLTCDATVGYTGGPAVEDVERVPCAAEIVGGATTAKALRALAHGRGWRYLPALKQDRCPQHPGPNLRAGRPVARRWK
jgi:hypothetical protein